MKKIIVLSLLAVTSHAMATNYNVVENDDVIAFFKDSNGSYSLNKEITEEGAVYNFAPEHSTTTTNETVWINTGLQSTNYDEAKGMCKYFDAENNGLQWRLPTFEEASEAAKNNDSEFVAAFSSAQQKTGFAQKYQDTSSTNGYYYDSISQMATPTTLSPYARVDVICHHK
ncbi:hypothetical protein [Photobacterium damselae]|uniref:hypothetical protein n=1 Tax=Photobacterium damselae TaxID=38293 RepID=UPI0013021186|nr:hypothetical protein [Photobacterium damselae]